MKEIWVQSLSQEDPQEEDMATHSSILASKIPWSEETGRLQSVYVYTPSHFTHVWHLATLWTVGHQVPVLGILQARILEWITMLPPGDLPHPEIELESACVSYAAGRFFTHWATLDPFSP